MSRVKNNNKRFERRRARTRAKVLGSSMCPRLSVFRSNQHLYVQLIDDTVGKTLASVHSRELGTDAKRGVAQAMELGKRIAQKAKAAKIASVVFDRSGYRYHGRVRAVAEGAREGGLTF